jgi:uncharacterized protein (DUF952 family)
MILHLVAKLEWEAKAADQPYTPKAFAQDGFIHCTQGEALLLQVANNFYKSVPGEFFVIAIDEHKVKAEVKWEAPQAPAAGMAHATTSTTIEAPPEAKAEYGAEIERGATSIPPAAAAPMFPHIYGPLNRDAIVNIRRMVRASDGTFTGYATLAPSQPEGMNLKPASQLAQELLDATDGFSDALARYKDHVEAHMDELDKNIKDKLN